MLTMSYCCRVATRSLHGSGEIIVNMWGSWRWSQWLIVPIWQCGRVGNLVGWVALRRAAIGGSFHVITGNEIKTDECSSAAPEICE